MNDMTKVKATTFIGAYEKLAPDDYCDKMIAKFEEFARDTSKANPSDSSDGTAEYGAKARKDLSFYYHRLQESRDLAVETNKILDQGLQLYMADYPSLQMCHNFYSFVIKVQKTPPKGGFHTWHCERGFEELGRCLVWTIYLNDIPDGEGETEFLEYGTKVQPKKGTVCFFPADWTHVHRGNAIYSKDKYIATGWYNIS